MLKGWERRGKHGLTRAAARALRARGPAGDLPDLADLERILLIRQQNQLGDMLLSTPVYRAVRARSPRARIDLIAAPQNIDAVRHSAHLDEVLLYDKSALMRNPARAAGFLRRIREARYELVVVQSTVSFSYTSAWLAAVSRAERRAGRPGPGGRGADIARDVYHWVLPDPVEGRHQTAVNLDLLRPFGVGADSGPPEIFLTDAEEKAGRSAADAAFAARDGSQAAGADAIATGTERGPRGTRVILHPGAGKKPNRWPADRFGRVAAALEDAGHAVAVASGPSEVGLLAEMDRGAGRRFRRLPPMGFRELAGAFRAADLLLANDTGVLHLGAAAGVKVLTLFGPTDPQQWCPATPNVRFLHAPGGCLEDLPLEVVQAAGLAWAAALRDGTPETGIAQSAPRLDT